MQQHSPSGLDTIPLLNWGAHLTQIYDSEDDLRDLLVPYFKAGLENNESCLWVTGAPFGTNQARSALRAAVGDFDKREKRKQIEIKDAREWFTSGDRLRPQDVVAGLLQREQDALDHGYQGLRTNGNCRWVEADQWTDFQEYESLVQKAVRGRRMICMCSYCSDQNRGGAFLDVMKHHDFVLPQAHRKLQLESAAQLVADGVPAVLESIPAAIYATDAAGRITFCNQAAANLAGRRPVIGQDEAHVTWRLFRPDGTPLPHDERPMTVALKENRPVRGAEILAERPDGKRIFVMPHGSPIRDEFGAVVGAVNMLVDVSERRADGEALRDSEARLSTELAAVNELQRISTALMHEQDTSRLYKSLVDAAAKLMQSDFATMQMLHPDRGQKGELQMLAHRGFDAEAIKFWDWVRADSGCTCGVALKTGKRGIASDVATCDFMAGTPDRDALLEAGVQAAQSTPLFSRAGRLLGMISTHWRKPHSPSESDLQRFDILARLAADLIERKLTEDQITLLGREAEHRTKNLLATVQAAVRLTRADTLAEYKDAIEGRIQALAKSHSLFAQSRWAGADLRSLVQQELLPYGRARTEIVGADLSLEPSIAQMIGLCVHELTTNAAKYGALSVAGGRVRVEWSRAGDGRVSLRWAENGGPVVKPPTRRGFGTKMLETFMQMKGKMQLDWRPEGVRCEIILPDSAEAHSETAVAAE